MIQYREKESIFESKADALVNPVNCVGIMGAGLAKEFKKRYPKMFEQYHIKCEREELKIGKLDVFKTLDKVIINFPTKEHWKNRSKLEWIEAGLQDFVKRYKSWNINSIAFPQLGTGNGQLKWEDVKLLMERFLEPLEIKAEIYVF